MADKILERTLVHHYSIGDPGFRHEMSVMMGPAAIPGNSVTPLQNGAEIFPAMLEAIEGAEVSITFETHIYWSGEIGRRFAEALAGAAGRGIPVNILLDWVGCLKMDEDLLDLMKSAGVRVYYYRPLRWFNLNKVNNRTHRKLMVVDGRIGFTGGVGIADQWQGHAQDPDHWRDSHYRVEGPVVAQIQAAFNDNWIKTTSQVLNGPKYFVPLEDAGDMNAHMFISSPSGGSESMHLMYLMAVAAAEQSIDLAASYFVPDDLIIKALLSARERKVRVRIMVPGEHIDSDVVRVSSKACWGKLLQAGIEIYEYQPTMLHTKLLVIDRQFVSVGSTNFDIRSFRLNDEASLNIYEHDFASRMTEVFENDLRQTRQFNYDMWKHRPASEKLSEAFVWPLRPQL